MKKPKIKPRLMWGLVYKGNVTAVFLYRKIARDNAWDGEIIQRVFVTAPRVKK